MLAMGKGGVKEGESESVWERGDGGEERKKGGSSNKRIKQVHACTMMVDRAWNSLK